jgi:hypothetical protein
LNYQSLSKSPQPEIDEFTPPAVSRHWMFGSFCDPDTDAGSQHSGESTRAVLTIRDTAEADISSGAYGEVMRRKLSSDNASGENHS